MKMNTVTMMLILVSLLIVACGVPRYATIDSVPPEGIAVIEDIEQGYIDRAKEKAQFLTKCAPEKVSAEVLEYIEGMMIPYQGHFYVKAGRQISTIGVDACGQRLVYKIICGVYDVYAWELLPPSHMSNTNKPCSMGQEGSSAISDIQMQNAEDEKHLQAVRAQRAREAEESRAKQDF